MLFKGCCSAVNLLISYRQKKSRIGLPFFYPNLNPAKEAPISSSVMPMYLLVIACEL